MFRNRLLESSNISVDRDQVNQIFNALTVNAVIFAAAILLFELNRGIKLIYLRRCKSKYIKSERVPNIPSRFPLSWVFNIMVSDDETVKMIGLDGYVLLRYIKLCFK